MTKSLLFVLMGCVLTVHSAAAQGPLADTLPTGGVNLGPYAYFQRGQPFVNYAKMSDEWFSSDGFVWADGRSLTLTTGGYPAELASDQIARSLIFTHNGEYYQPGRYVVSWEGTGDVGFGSFGPTPQVVESLPNQVVYDIESTGAIGLIAEIRATDPTDPVRNIRIVEQRYADQESIFHPDYLADLENYGVLRNLLWSQTNSSSQQSWLDRPQLTDAHWGGARGIPWEIQIDLANEMQQDLWINIPHLANNDYVRELGHLIEERLDPDLRVWLEYTNEYWNPAFGQNNYLQNVMVPRLGVPSIVEAYSQRATEVYAEFAQSFSTDRTIRVFGGWAAVPYALETGLPYITDEQGVTSADVATIGAYFDLDQDQLNALYQDFLNDAVDMDQVFQLLREDIDTAAVTWKLNAEHAAAHGLPLVAYEAGQHIVTYVPEQQNNEQFLSLLYEIQRDPRMGELYDYMFEKWLEIGGSTIVMFDNIDTWSRHGTWGLKDNMNDTDSVKKAAVDRFLLANPTGFDVRTGGWFGDVNGNGLLDADDIDQLTVAVRDGSEDPRWDLNRDGIVSLEDRTYWINTIRDTDFGDTNLDGIVTTDDLIIAFQSGTYEDDVLQNGLWSLGDWNGDFEFDTGDLVVLFQAQSFTRTAQVASAPIPEPSGLALVTSGILFAARRNAARARRRGHDRSGCCLLGP